jgi:hypothetical protein
VNNGLCGVHAGWAVALKFDHGWSLLGPGWFGWGLPAHADGCRTSVFSTKKAATEAMRGKAFGESFKIVRVIVNVVENRHFKVKP